MNGNSGPSIRTRQGYKRYCSGGLHAGKPLNTPSGPGSTGTHLRHWASVRCAQRQLRRVMGYPVCRRVVADAADVVVGVALNVESTPTPSYQRSIRTRDPSERTCSTNKSVKRRLEGKRKIGRSSLSNNPRSSSRPGGSPVTNPAPGYGGSLRRHATESSQGGTDWRGTCLIALYKPNGYRRRAPRGVRHACLRSVN